MQAPLVKVIFFCCKYTLHGGTLFRQYIINLIVPAALAVGVYRNNKDSQHFVYHIMPQHRLSHSVLGAEI